MSAAAVQVGRVRYERHGHVQKMVIDKPGLTNAIASGSTPST
jgi:hypothetical protein